MQNQSRIVRSKALKIRRLFGLRWQSIAATPLSDPAERKRILLFVHGRQFKSVGALRLPPHYKVRWVVYAERLPPLLGFHLRLGGAEFEDYAFGEFHQRGRPARVEYRVRQVARVCFEPRGINAPAPAGPGIVGR